jgi:hypothetical protein
MPLSSPLSAVIVAGKAPEFLRRFSISYQWMSVCMDIAKCIVMKLQKLQTSSLAQIYLLTIEIDLPSDTKKFRHFGRQPTS